MHQLLVKIIIAGKAGFARNRPTIVMLLELLLLTLQNTTNATHLNLNRGLNRK